MIVVGCFSVLVATLATIAIFLRLRTASLTEIQVRLAALEEMIAARDTERGKAGGARHSATIDNR